MLEVNWAEGPGGTVDVSTEEELDQLLDRIHRDSEGNTPRFIELCNADGDTLQLGLGRPYSLLSFTPGDGEPPYYASKGDPSLAGNPPHILFYYLGGHYSEFPASTAIDTTAAREAARIFLQTEARPTNVEWQEV